MQPNLNSSFADGSGVLSKLNNLLRIYLYAV